MVVGKTPIPDKFLVISFSKIFLDITIILIDILSFAYIKFYVPNKRCYTIILIFVFLKKTFCRPYVVT